MILMVIFSMLFLHIIADFLVQNNFMARFKQKKEWDRYFVERHEGFSCPRKYNKDYIPVLFVHAFSWAFITYLPLLHYVFYSKTLISETWCVFVLIQTFVHMHIDNMKCNKFEINLIIDQLLHLLQILSGGLLVWMLS